MWIRRYFVEIWKTILLTNEEKYEIAQFESDTLKKNIEEGRIKSDQILETLRVCAPILFFRLFWRKLIRQLRKLGRMPSTSRERFWWEGRILGLVKLRRRGLRSTLRRSWLKRYFHSL